MSSVFSAIQWPFGVAVGTAVGGAAAGAITPGVQEIINEANAAHAVKPPSYFMLAEGVAKHRVDPTWARDRAAEQGIGNDAFGRLVQIANVGPGVAVAFELWRRDLIDDGGFARAIGEEAIPDEWLAPLRGLRERLLSPAELANARQQEFIGDGRMHSEGGLQGYSNERMDLMFKMAGLPPGPMDGLTMLRRGLITESEYRALVAEGHTKTKYTDALLGLEPHILSQTDAANLWLRGWITEPEAKAIGQQNGYDGAAMDLLYKNRGRPATVRQAHIGFARGGRLPGAGNDEKETIRRSVQESNIRTEWFDLLYAQRYTYPSAFVLRALATDGTFSQAETEQILIESGWKPEWAAAASEKWTGSGAGPSTKWADRAKSQLFSAAHSDYMDGNADEVATRAMLARIGAVGAEQDAIVGIWEMERNRTRRDLTQAQILKLYKKSIWTQDQALAGLDDLGMDIADATALLASV